MNRTRVLLVDDQSLFREGLGTLLNLSKTVEVVGYAADGHEAINSYERLKPDVVLMDLRMPGMGGIDATKAIRSKHPAARILVLTTFEEDEEIFAAVKAGAAGYLLKAAPSERLLEAIAAAFRGESVLQPSVAAKLMGEYNRLASKESRKPAVQLVEPLSSREAGVLRALTEGLSNKEIAARLGITEGTVKNHMTNVFGKLGVLDRTQAALRGKELGLV